MERKLQDLKEEFCKWYCPKKDEEICFECNVSEYIIYIRDQLK